MKHEHIAQANTVSLLAEYAKASAAQPPYLARPQGLVNASEQALVKRSGIISSNPQDVEDFVHTTYRNRAIEIARRIIAFAKSL